MDENGSQDAKRYTTLKATIRVPIWRTRIEPKWLILFVPNYGRVGGTDELCDDVPEFKPRLMIIFTSTRRFCWRPVEVVLSATESVFP